MSSLIDQQFAADLLAISVRRLAKMVRDGELPFIELPGGEIRFSREDLQDWIGTRKRGIEDGNNLLARV